MTLHGDICVNYTRIGSWSARRVLTGETNVYDCEVILLDDGAKATSRETFQVEHRYEDGAPALAAKVLSGGSECSPDCEADHAPCTRRRWLESIKPLATHTESGASNDSR